jgi:putative ATPase
MKSSYNFKEAHQSSGCISAIRRAGLDTAHWRYAFRRAYKLDAHIVQLATTENPSFKITGALLSRCKVMVLDKLSDDDMSKIIHQAIWRLVEDSESMLSESTQTSFKRSEIKSDIEHPSSLSAPDLLPPIEDDDTPPKPSDKGKDSVPFPAYPHLKSRVIQTIASLANGDARVALGLLELALASPSNTEESTLLEQLRRCVSTSYDRTGDSRYDMISALHKSIRTSDGSAALYWLARMLVGGEDPVRLFP